MLATARPYCFIIIINSHRQHYRQCQIPAILMHVCLSVCLSVCVCVGLTLVSLAKIDKLIEMSLERQTRAWVDL